MFRKLLCTYKICARRPQNIICRCCKSSESSPSNSNIRLNGISVDSLIEDLYRGHADDNNNAKLRPIKLLLDSRNSIIDEIDRLSELLSDHDPAMVKLATEEKTTYASRLKDVENALADAVLEATGGANDTRVESMVLEVNAGVGGQEAMLFASELFAMYIKFIAYRGWPHYVAERQHSELGGLRHGSVIVRDARAFEDLQHEAGVHRVQRVPATERGGRVHTSTASVLALPQPTDIQVRIEPRDLRIETKRASGAGGQHVNTTDSAVRIVHVPSGIAVECQTDRSQIRNRQIALERLRAQLYERQLRAQQSHTQSVKAAQVLCSDRSRKVRTYNYAQDRVTDHRLQRAAQAPSAGHVYDIRTFLLGGQQLQALIDKFKLCVKYEKLARAASECEMKKRK